jgi:hypothetical protein
MAIRTDSHWDLSVNNRAGQLILAVEVKRKTQASAKWAAQLRRNILAHGTFPKTPYFLMAFPDKFYLWTDPDSPLDYSEPTYTIDAQPILEPYLKRSGLTADQISGHSLELIISSWLGEIMYSDQLEDLDNSQQWLMESGLYKALAGGQLEHEAVA